MEQELKSMSFIAACRTFFGILPNQQLSEFAKEVKALTDKDRTDLIEMFKTVGIDATKTN